MVSKDDLGIVPDIRTVGAWIQIDKDAIFHLEVGCKDTKAAKRFDDYLAQKGLENGKPLPFLMNRMQSQRLATDLAATLKREQKEEWVIVEAKSPIRDLVSATTQRVTQGNISYQ